MYSYFYFKLLYRHRIYTELQYFSLYLIVAEFASVQKITMSFSKILVLLIESVKYNLPKLVILVSVFYQ